MSLYGIVSHVGLTGIKASEYREYRHVRVEYKCVLTERDLVLLFTVADNAVKTEAAYTACVNLELDIVVILLAINIFLSLLEIFGASSNSLP